jgi:glycine C-acetyltransferase
MVYSEKLIRAAQFAGGAREIRTKGLYKEKRFICSPQDAGDRGRVPRRRAAASKVLNFCANNYLGLSPPRGGRGRPRGSRERGYGMGSVRFICGTQDIHRELENKLTEFLGTEDTLLFPSCMDANAGVFEAILGSDDVMIADRLVHASIVDGIRLCSAQRDTFKHMNMKHLEKKLQEHQDKRIRLIVTDGVFSMDGDLIQLDEIVALAEKYDAMVLVDDSHSSGFIGKTGRGTHEHFGVMGKIDLITTTLGKALGGASGGCVSGRKELIELCRQKARPYLFSNTLAPSIVKASIKVFDLLIARPPSGATSSSGTPSTSASRSPRRASASAKARPDRPGHALQRQAGQRHGPRHVRRGHLRGRLLLPGGPAGAARIRVQLSAAHDKEMIDKCVAAFARWARKGILGEKGITVRDVSGSVAGRGGQEGLLPSSRSHTNGHVGGVERCPCSRAVAASPPVLHRKRPIWLLRRRMARMTLAMTAEQWSRGRSLAALLATRARSMLRAATESFRAIRLDPSSLRLCSACSKARPVPKTSSWRWAAARRSFPTCRPSSQASPSVAPTFGPVRCWVSSRLLRMARLQLCHVRTTPRCAGSRSRHWPCGPTVPPCSPLCACSKTTRT